MKKILLFTILCAGQLYGMGELKIEVQKDSEALLPELKKEIISKLLVTLATSDNLNDIIKALEISGLRYDDINDFTNLLHLLADRFKSATTTIAEEVKTLATNESLKLVAQKYLSLANAIQMAIIFGGDAAKVAEVIKQGADVNASYRNGHDASLLIIAIENRTDAAIIKLLLDAGANPHYKYKNTHGSWEVLDYAKKVGASEEVIKFLQDTMKKRPQS